MPQPRPLSGNSMVPQFSNEAISFSFFRFFGKTSQACMLKVTTLGRGVSNWIYVFTLKHHEAKVQIGWGPEIRGDCGVNASNAQHQAPCPWWAKGHCPLSIGLFVKGQRVSCECQRKVHISMEGPGPRERSGVSVGFLSNCSLLKSTCGPILVE